MMQMIPKVAQLQELKGAVEAMKKNYCRLQIGNLVQLNSACTFL